MWWCDGVMVWFLFKVGYLQNRPFTNSWCDLQLYTCSFFLSILDLFSYSFHDDGSHRFQACAFILSKVKYSYGEPFQKSYLEHFVSSDQLPNQYCLLTMIICNIFWLFKNYNIQVTAFTAIVFLSTFKNGH